jgi:deazaflavin-dependent oxidoreductase (nitroreductase family)
MYAYRTDLKMTKQRYSLLNSFIQKIASTRPASWFFSRTLHHIDWVFLKLSSGRITLTPILAGTPTIVLTTTGAKSGLPRSLPLVCIRNGQDPNVFALIASNFGQQHNPAWYFNLKANPHATCSIGGQVGKYIAHEASGEEYERFWQLATEMYFGYSLYKQRAANRKIPIMVLMPENS